MSHCITPQKNLYVARRPVPLVPPNANTRRDTPRHWVDLYSGRVARANELLGSIRLNLVRVLALLDFQDNVNARAGNEHWSNCSVFVFDARCSSYVRDCLLACIALAGAWYPVPGTRYLAQLNRVPGTSY